MERLIHSLARTLLFGLLACSGCFGRGPGAYRIRPDTNDRYYPQREIHFVEHGHRSKGVLVMATSGGDSPFTVGWGTILVPLPPAALDGPVWKGRANREEALAITELPIFRNADSVGLYGKLARFRFRAPSIWVLSTDPFIVGLPAGEPLRSWRQFAVMATGVRDAEHISPVPPLIVRFIVDEELDQPLGRLVIYPSDFWKQAPSEQIRSVKLSVVNLQQPLRIDDALDAITTSNPLRLGEVETVPLYEHFESDQDAARRLVQDRERLLSQ
jgi:hypothetical protein